MLAALLFLFDPRGFAADAILQIEELRSAHEMPRLVFRSHQRIPKSA